MSKPRLLDLFCGAGGAAMGYHRAGFEVVGVDVEPQPNYPFPFRLADALGLLGELINRRGESLRWSVDSFDAIHASPPCQSYSKAMKHLSHPQPELIEPVRELLNESGLPWVIENVPGAPLPTQETLDGRYGVELCGSMFGLRLRRHRLFECSFPISFPCPCDHSEPAFNAQNQAGRDRIYEEFGRQDPDPVWNREMGVEWMGRYEGREAVPPAYTEYIGNHLMQHLEHESHRTDQDPVRESLTGRS